MIRWGFVFALILLVSCRSGHDLAGKYMDKYGHRLQLSADSTFRYAHWSFHLYMASSGRFAKVGPGKFLLNSTKRSVIVPMNVTEVKTEGLSRYLTVQLKVLDGKNPQDYSCKININGKSLRTLRCDSLSGIELPARVDSLILFFTETPRVLTSNRISQSLKTRSYKPVGRFSTNMVVEATLDDSHFSYEPFIDRELRVGFFRLKVFNFENRRWDSLKKVDGKTIIFSVAFGR